MVSLSGGKDSTAMLLLMIERNMPIDAVFTADTGMEFPEMYPHLERLDEFLYRERGLHITTLRHPKGFEWLMFEEPKSSLKTVEWRRKLGIPLYGNGWPAAKSRWCTGHLKTHLMRNALVEIKKQYRLLTYIGIAADEPKRVHKDRYPLVDWQISEKEALQVCKSRGYDWSGLYDIYRRCSCWCCPLQPLGELRKLHDHHPNLWKRLCEMDKRAKACFGDHPLGQFKTGWTVPELEQRFEMEKAQLSFYDSKEVVTNGNDNSGDDPGGTALRLQPKHTN